MDETYQEYSNRMLLEEMRRHRNPYCHPADTPGPIWYLKFDDQDRNVCIYHDEQEALLAFARAESLGWNCHLFVSVKRAASACKD